MHAIRGAVLPRIPGNPYSMPGHFCFAPDDGQGGNSHPPPENPPAEPKKIELTEEELQARIEAAVKKERDRAAAAAEEERKKREAEAARKAGEFEKLYNAEVEARKAEQQAREQAELRARRAEVYNRLASYLSEKHPEYTAAAKYMQPLLEITADTSDDDVEKQIKTVVEQYVKDNPRAKSVGTTSGANRGKESNGDDPRVTFRQKGGNVNIPRVTGAAALM